MAEARTKGSSSFEEMKSPPVRKLVRRALWTAAILFVAVNIIAAFHAYTFTHYKQGGQKTKSSGLSFSQKLEILFTGIDNPRPVDSCLPGHPYETIRIHSNVPLECWRIPAVKGTKKGTIVMFHGYTSSKSSLLTRAEPLLQNGYDCLLVDFMGSGGSGGNATTVGYKEAEEVKDCYGYIRRAGERKVFLYGTSMGAVAVMKAIKDYALQPDAIVVDCPFGTMYKTICARFRKQGVPTFPMAAILLFWGSVENGFWGFAHCPVDDAKYIFCPTLLQCGGKDEYVSRQEIDDIYQNLHCSKQLSIYPQAAHDNCMRVCGNEWSRTVLSFLADK